MKKIQDNVLQVIRNFVDKGECFTSLDVYCMLGIRFNDESYPIYDQVGDAYRQRLMGQYLTEFVHLPIEHGGSVKAWRYYLPKSEKKEFTCQVNQSLVLSAEILGQFPLLDINMELLCQSGIIRLVPTSKQPSEEYGFHVQNTSKNVVIPLDVLKKYDLDTDIIKVTVFESKIELTK